MKKLYTEPELELLSIRLLADVLGPSQDKYVEEETMPEVVETFGDDDGFTDI